MKALIAGIAGLLVTTACGSTSVAQHLGATPSASPSAVAVLDCRLPVGGYVVPSAKGQPDRSMAADGLPNQQGMGGFLAVPGGAYSPDAGSDRAYVGAKWLPVLPSAVAPDGQSYASTAGPKLYVSDTRTRTPRLLHEWPAGVIAEVIGFTAEGIYVITVSGAQPAPPTTQLFVVRVDSGDARPVPGSATPKGAYEMVWTAVRDGAAWGALITISGQAATNELVRLDLATGTTTNWWKAPLFPTVGGFDSAGHPLIPTMLIGPADLAVVTGPDQITMVEPTGGTFLPGRPSIVSDSHGAWFGSTDGSIWLYTSAGELKKVGTVPPAPGATGQPYDPHAYRSVAGPCV